MSFVAQIAAAVGKGLLAGFVGTAAMTLSSTLEAKARGRKPSDAPARAAAKVLGVSPIGENEKKRFATLVHWGYGTSWGAARGVIAAAGWSGVPAAVAFFGAVWGTELTMLPLLGVAPPATEWERQEIAIDAWHHVVYASTASLVYEWLDHHDRT